MTQTMISAAIVEPYAEALMSLGEDSGLTDRFSQDVAGILTALQSAPELTQVLVNPFVKPEAKKAVLNQVFGSQVDGTVLKFLGLLVDRRRAMYLEAICAQYQALVRQARNIILAEVISATELNDGQRQAVIDKVKSMTGATQVELATRLESDLIGGVIIKIGSRVLDASIRGQLRRLSNSLLSSAV
jgi:F-type H+-transporting ATPase subunit delta